MTNFQQILEIHVGVPLRKVFQCIKVSTVEIPRAFYVLEQLVGINSHPDGRKKAFNERRHFCHQAHTIS